MSLLPPGFALALLCCFAVPVLAAEPTAVSTIEERLQTLESRQAELYHTLAEKKQPTLAEQIGAHLTLSGLIEVETAFTGIEYAAGSSDASSDLTLATAQLGLGSQFNDRVAGNLALLYEEGGELEVDEAAIDLTYGTFFARAGRHYLPFGVFRSHFVSDPLTQVLGETRATALQIGSQHALVSFSAYAFNGAVDKAGAENHVTDGGASLVVTPVAGVTLGGSYLSDLAESNAGLLAGPYAKRVAAWSAHLNLERGPFFCEAEYLAAARAFAVADFDADGDGRGDKPRAWNVEIAYRPAELFELALRYEGSAEFSGQPEYQYGAAFSWSPWERTTLALEYLRSSFDSAFGNGITSRDQVTTQLAYAF